MRISVTNIRTRDVGVKLKILRELSDEGLGILVPLAFIPAIHKGIYSFYSRHSCVEGYLFK